MSDWETDVRLEAKLDTLLSLIAGERAHTQAAQRIKKAMDERRDPLVEEWVLERMGFERRYYLIGHPAWPDPLNIWPATAEHAQEVWDEHPHPEARIVLKWEGGPRTEAFPKRPEEAWEHKSVRAILIKVSDPFDTWVEVYEGEEFKGKYQNRLLRNMWPTYMGAAVENAFPGWQQRQVSKSNQQIEFDIYRLKEQP